VGNKRLNPARRALLNGLRAAPPTDWETMVPALPAWTTERLTQLSDARAEAVAAADATVLGDPDHLRWSGEGTGEDLAEPPTTMPTAAAAGAMEQALAGSLRALRKRRAAVPGRQPEPGRAAVSDVPGRELVRELGRRVGRRVPRPGR
jgi:hypothetical protein